MAIQPTGYFWVSVNVVTPYGYSNPYHIGDPISFEFQVTNKGSNTIKHWEMVVELYYDETGEYLMTYRNERYENIEHGEKKTVYCGTYTPQTDDDLYFNWEFAAWRPDGVREVCTSGSNYWLRIIPQEGNTPPVARFTYTPANPKVNQPVYLDASDSYDPDGYITDYYWDWDGDGGFEGYGKTPTHTFTEPGTYGVTLLVYDNENEGNWTRQYITVEEGEQPPTITISISTWVVIATTTASIGLLIAISRWLL